MLLVRIYHLLAPGSRFQQWPIPSSADRCARNLRGMQDIPAIDERLAKPWDTWIYLPSPAASPCGASGPHPWPTEGTGRETWNSWFIFLSYLLLITPSKATTPVPPDTLPRAGTSHSPHLCPFLDNQLLLIQHLIQIRMPYSPMKCPAIWNTLFWFYTKCTYLSFLKNCWTWTWSLPCSLIDESEAWKQDSTE